MSINEINFIILLFFILIFNFFISAQTTFLLLILSELFWITLYLTVVILSILGNNIYLLSLTLFFLIFSAVEISIGLLVIYLQSLFLNTLVLPKLFFNLWFFKYKYLYLI